MLEVDNIFVHYGRVPAVRGVSVTVNAGEIVCIVGPNGAGKSTTLLTVAGALSPSQGTVKLDGVSIAGQAPENIARKGISLVPEGRHVFTQLTVEENIRLGTDMRADKKGVEEDFELVLSYFPFLRERLTTPGGKLSGGEQQQLVIARALMTRPKLMLIDEPSLGLGPLIVDRVYEILHTLRNAGNTLLVVEQSTHRALENCDRVYVLRSGQIELHGKASELTDEAVERAYFGFEAATARRREAHF
ncbi:MAG: ABC transporter ATP-binding protein [Alphaproteobacteria bacterium]|nr:ABC transporter ATP-binding protein [Alphaproteobacteria bacterium]